MHPAIASHQAAIAAICRQFGIKRLDVFGSAARAHDFNPLSSDADFLVEFAQQSRTGLNNYLGTKAALEATLGRPVDLVEAGAVHNPFILAAIHAHKETLYAA